MSDFFYMGGYAVYVWSSLGLGLIVLVLNILIPLATHRAALKKAGDYHASEAINGDRT